MNGRRVCISGNRFVLIAASCRVVCPCRRSGGASDPTTVAVPLLRLGDKIAPTASFRARRFLD